MSLRITWGLSLCKTRKLAIKIGFWKQIYFTDGFFGLKNTLMNILLKKIPSDILLSVVSDDTCKFHKIQPTYRVINK